MNENGRLSGERILVTGGGRGIGAEVARHVSAAGAEVIVVDIDEANAKRIAAELESQGGKATPYRVDVSDLEDVRRLARTVEQQLGDITGLVNCAGVSLDERFEDPDFIEKWRLSFSVNVDGTMYMIHSFLEQIKRTRGKVVNIASTCAFVSGNCPTGYAPTKAAVKLLTQTLARDLAKYGIRVNAVAPAAVATAMTVKQRKNDEMVRNFEARSKLKRPAEAREIAAPIVMLLSEEASYITGVTMPIDGGILI